jgi:two-component system chemotaxis response regulator CheB
MGREVTGIGCPDCPGALTVSLQGSRGFLHFQCRIGHAYSLEEVLQAKEAKIEDRLWAAVLAAEEMVALLNDLEEYSAGPLADAPLHYRVRSEGARLLATALRQLIGQDRPLHLVRIDRAVPGIELDPDATR